MYILSWNVGLVLEWFRYLFMGRLLNKEKTLNLISEYINDNDNDILFFQELFYPEFNKIDKKNFNFSYCDNKTGLSIISKRDIEIIKTVYFKKNLINYIFNSTNGFIICYDSEQDIYLINIHLSCLHFYFNSELETLKKEIDLLKTKDKKIILGGDFNITRYYSLILKQLFKIKFNIENKDNSYNYLCNVNIDYFFEITKETFKELKTSCIKTFESDHFPILTEIK